VVKGITIYFKPLGLNAFLKDNLCHYCSDEQQMFMPFDDYQARFQKILTIPSEDEMLEELEEYWLGKYQGSCSKH